MRVDGLRAFRGDHTVFRCERADLLVLKPLLPVFAAGRNAGGGARLKAIYRAEPPRSLPAACGFDAGPGAKISDDCRELAPKLGQSLPFTVIRRRCEDHLHHNAIESLHMQLRRCLRIEGTFRATKRPPSSSIWPCEHHQIVDKSAADLEDGGQPICHPIWAEI